MLPKLRAPLVDETRMLALPLAGSAEGSVSLTSLLSAAGRAKVNVLALDVLERIRSPSETSALLKRFAPETVCVDVRSTYVDASPSILLLSVVDSNPACVDVAVAMLPKLSAPDVEESKILDEALKGSASGNVSLMSFATVVGLARLTLLAAEELESTKSASDRSALLKRLAPDTVCVEVRSTYVVASPSILLLSVVESKPACVEVAVAMLPKLSAPLVDDNKTLDDALDGSVDGSASWTPAAKTFGAASETALEPFGVASRSKIFAEFVAVPLSAKSPTNVLAPDIVCGDARSTYTLPRLSILDLSVLESKPAFDVVAIGTLPKLKLPDTSLCIRLSVPLGYVDGSVNTTSLASAVGTVSETLCEPLEAASCNARAPETLACVELTCNLEEKSFVPLMVCVFATPTYVDDRASIAPLSVFERRPACVDVASDTLPKLKLPEVSLTSILDVALVGTDAGSLRVILEVREAGAAMLT